MWLHDCLQRNKQKFNISSKNIRLAAGGIFITSIATIAYNLPPHHTSAEIFELQTAVTEANAVKKVSWFNKICNRINGPKPWLRVLIRTRAIRGLLGVAIGSYSLGVEDLYVSLNLSGWTGTSEKY